MKKFFWLIVIAVVLAYLNKTNNFYYTVNGNANPSVPLIFSFSWPLYHQEHGLTIYKKEGDFENYLFVIDPFQKRITIQNYFAKMDQHWARAGDPVCIFNAGFFESDGTPSFPIIENGNILHGAVTGQYPAKILYIRGDTLSIEDIWSNAKVQSADWAISGLNPSYYKGDTTVTNRTLIGLKENLLYIFITQIYTFDELVTIFTDPYQLGINSNNILGLDSGYSTQVRCFNNNLLDSPSVMGSTLVISKH